MVIAFEKRLHSFIPSFTVKRVIITLVALQCFLISSASNPTGIQAEFRNGQVFITWNNIAGNSAMYRVYRSTSPITSPGQLNNCEYLGHVNTESAMDHCLSIHFNTDYYLVIDSAQTPLSPNMGLFVATSYDSGQFYYAVTTMVNGVEDSSLVSGVNTLSSPVTESVEDPQPVFREVMIVNQAPVEVYTTFTSLKISPDGPLMNPTGCIAQDFLVFRNGATSPTPLRVRFHGGGSDLFNRITENSGDEMNLGLEDLFPDNDHSSWFGLNDSYNIYSKSNNPPPAPSNSVVYTFTLTRIKKTIEWVIEHFPVDSNKVFLEGSSYGSIGAYFTALYMPDKIAATKISGGFFDGAFQNDYNPNCTFNTGKKNRIEANSKWGLVQDSLSCDLNNFVYNALNGAWILHQNADQDYPLIFSVNGKNDAQTGWTEKVTYYDSINANRSGGWYFFDQRQHGGQGKNWNFDGNLDLLKYRKDQSYPAFSYCSINGNPGNGNGNNGDQYGTINGFLDWSTQITDSTNLWQIELFIRDLLKENGTYETGADSCITDITPRRLQNFEIETGDTLYWGIQHSGEWIQSGTVAYLQAPLVIPQVKVFKDTVTFILQTTATTFYPDMDQDGFGDASVFIKYIFQPANYVTNNLDCNDSNSSIHPGMADGCNATDDDCDGFTDEDAAPVLQFADADGDGFGNAAASFSPCALTVGFATNSDDCDDSDSTINPLSAEICNSKDDDCDGLVDENLAPLLWYLDADNDGFGSSDSSVMSCDSLIGYSLIDGDCNDDDLSISPSAIEVCNGMDDNCNGIIDEPLIPVQIIATDSTTLCENDSLLIVATSFSSGSSLQWFMDGESIPNAEDSFLVVASDGTFYLQTSADSCSYTSNSVSVTVQQNPNPFITPNGVIATCINSTVFLSTEFNPAYSYQWIKNNALINGATSFSYTVPAFDSGYYQVSAQSGLQCSGLSASVQITRKPLPKAKITPLGDLNICITGSVQLRANTGSEYAWQWYRNNITLSGATSRYYTTSQTGKYRVAVTNTYGCSKLSAVVNVISSCKTVEDDGDATVLQIYPNPAADYVELILSNPVSGKLSISILSILGEECYSMEKTIGDLQLVREKILLPDLLTDGLYFIKVISGDHCFTEPLLIQKN